MFRIDVLQNQWLGLALIGGAALVCLAILWYLALWRSPEREAAERGGRSGGGVPWVLIVVYVGIALFAVVYVIVQSLYPPNW